MSNGQEVVESQDADMTKSATEQLREAIAKDGRDMKAIAEAADVPYTSVYRFMVKGSGLKLETAEALAKAVGMKLLRF